MARTQQMQSAGRRRLLWITTLLTGQKTAHNIFASLRVFVN